MKSLFNHFEILEDSRDIRGRKHELIDILIMTIYGILNGYTDFDNMADILFKSTSEAILTLAEDSKWLGAKPGITSILHTWGQTIEFHPHIHSIVTGGGLKNNQWISCDKDYLFKVQVLGSLFRGKFLYYLKHEFNKGWL